MQFNSFRSLRIYQIEFLSNYKVEFKAFFKFYQDFDFSLVISPHMGKTYTMEEYKWKYSDFKEKSLNIAGPINQASNCGAQHPAVKNHFVQLCKASTAFLKNHDL